MSCETNVCVSHGNKAVSLGAQKPPTCSRGIFLTPISRITVNATVRDDYNRERCFFLAGERHPCWDGRRPRKDVRSHPKPGDYFLFVLNSSEETARVQVFEIQGVKDPAYRLSIWPGKYAYTGGQAEATDRPFLELSRYLFTCPWKVLKQKLGFKNNHSPQGTERVATERVPGGLEYLDRLRDMWKHKKTEVTSGEVAGVESNELVPSDGMFEGIPVPKPQTVPRGAVRKKLQQPNSAPHSPQLRDQISKLEEDSDEESPTKRPKITPSAPEVPWAAVEYPRVAKHVLQTLKTLASDPGVAQYLSDSGLNFADLVRDILHQNMGTEEEDDTVGDDDSSDNGDNNETGLEKDQSVEELQSQRIVSGDNNETGLEKDQSVEELQSQRIVSVGPIDQLNRLHKLAVNLHKRWNEVHKRGLITEAYMCEAEVCRQLRQLLQAHRLTDYDQSSDPSDPFVYFDFEQEGQENTKFKRRYNRRSALGTRPDFAGKHGTLIEVKMYRRDNVFPV